MAVSSSIVPQGEDLEGACGRRAALRGRGGGPSRGSQSSAAAAAVGLEREEPHSGTDARLPGEREQFPHEEASAEAEEEALNEGSWGEGGNGPLKSFACGGKGCRSHHCERNRKPGGSAARESRHRHRGIDLAAGLERKAAVVERFQNQLADGLALWEGPDCDSTPQLDLVLAQTAWTRVRGRIGPDDVCLGEGVSVTGGEATAGLYRGLRLANSGMPRCNRSLR